MAEFVLSGVSIRGTSIFSAADFEPAYRAYVGQRVGRAEISRIVQSITAKYREAGYFLSHAVALSEPLPGGVLDVRVIEGYIEQVTVNGGPPNLNDAARNYAADVTGERPLRLATLERGVLLLKDLPGIVVTPTVAPIDESAGRYGLAVTIDPHPFSGFFAVDNRGPRYEGPWETEARASIASLAMPYDELSASFFTVPNEPRELIAGGVAYSAPLGSSGLRSSVAFARSTIHPGDFLAPADLRGVTDTYAVSVGYPVLRSRMQSLWVSTSFNVIESREDVPDFNVFDDHLRVLRADATYVVSDSWDGNSRAFIQVSQGLSGLGSSPAGSPSASTPDGHAAFTKLAASMTHEHPLFDDFSIFLDLAGQKSWQPLLLSEQFSLGGVRFGRGYDPSQLVGDDALAGAVELRYGHPVEWGPVRAFQLYAFYDVGEVWNHDPGNAVRRASLASAGGGVRLTCAQDISLAVEIARPLTLPLIPDFNKPVRAFARLTKTF